MPMDYEVKIAEDILRVRVSQIIINEELRAGKFKIPIHLALGHESIAVAVANVMEDADKLILTHRNAAYNLARERLLKPIIDEYLLMPAGLAAGRLGSMNLMNPGKGVIYSSSILGNGFPVAVGIALAQKNLNSGGLTIVLGGDGSIEEGSFFESLTMLKSMDLSTMVIIEDNEWSLATRISERRCPINLAELCKSLGISHIKLAGNDPFAYIKKLKEARMRSLADQSPICIEVVVATLGDWVLESPEHPAGKSINYHAGATPAAEISKWPGVLHSSDQDPVFVLKNYFDEGFLREMSIRIAAEINKEIA